MDLKLIKTKNDLKPSDKDILIDAKEGVIRSILTSMKDKKIKKKVFVLGRDNVFNRRILETTNINYLISPERGERRDTLKQRDSGLNHVLAKIAKQNNIAIVIDYQSINKLKDLEKAKRLARVIQNIKICRKANCKIKIIDFSNKTSEKELKAFGTSLGMSSQQARDCIVS